MLRAFIIYAALLILVRISGRRTIGQFTPFDLLFVMLLSESVSSAFNGGEHSITGGLMAASTLVVLNLAVAFVTSRSRRLQYVVEGSGMGTSLALVGAYVLAGEIAKHENYRESFASYERILRPYVQRAQRLPPGAPGLAHPKTQIGISLFYGCARLAAMIQTTGIASKLFTAPADDFDLPDDSRV